jgi:hypothetical protein
MAGPVMFGRARAGEVIALGTSLASALRAFCSEHEYCGELDSRRRGRSCVDGVLLRGDDREAHR